MIRQSHPPEGAPEPIGRRTRRWRGRLGHASGGRLDRGWARAAAAWRRTGGLLVLLAALPGWLAVAGCGGGDAALVARIDAALASAAEYLVARQGADGAWSATVQKDRLDRPSVTSHVVSCLYFLPPPGGGRREAYRRGLAYLSRLADDDGRLAGGVALAHPVYTAAEASRMAVLPDRTPEHVRTQLAWLAVLSRFQHTEALGWKPADDDYGGWGLSRTVPMKPRPGGVPVAGSFANLSATLYGVAAYRSTDGPTRRSACAKALTFIRRCQNYADDPARADPRFDDGGFFFCLSVPEMNKAGVAGTDSAGVERYHSYGSMTADGLRGLLACGLDRSGPRVRAARKWLTDHFSVTRHPGRFTPETEWMREAFYYYYVWAVSHAWLHAEPRHLRTPRGRVDWPAALAEELMRRQRRDGSWANSAVEAFEDDALVATPWAASALAICRFVVAGDPPGAGPCQTGPSGKRPQ